MKNSFFKDKKILITGVSGFVGSNLAKNLTQLGAKVVGLSKSKKKTPIRGKNVVNVKIGISFILLNKLIKLLIQLK